MQVATQVAKYDALSVIVSLAAAPIVIAVIIIIIVTDRE
jgi:hypothetical protein